MKHSYDSQPSTIPAYFQGSFPNEPNLQKLQEQFNVSVSDDDKRRILELAGMHALKNGSIDGSSIVHVHRWTRAKQIKKIDNGSSLIILRCRRCELMKSVELFIEYDNNGRAHVKREDREIYPVITESSSSGSVDTLR